MDEPEEYTRVRFSGWAMKEGDIWLHLSGPITVSGPEHEALHQPRVFTWSRKSDVIKGCQFFKKRVQRQWKSICAIDQVCRYAFELRNGLLLSSHNLITNHPAHVFNVKGTWELGYKNEIGVFNTHWLGGSGSVKLKDPLYKDAHTFRVVFFCPLLLNYSMKHLVHSYFVLEHCCFSWNYFYCDGVPFVFSFSEVERAVPQEIYICSEATSFQRTFSINHFGRRSRRKGFFPLFFWMLRHSRVMVLKGMGQGKSHAWQRTSF